jgi:DGQHR domain-containing protein
MDTLNSSIPVYGTEKVPGHEFVATMPAAQLMKMTVDPRKTEDGTLRSDDTQLQEVYAIRQQVQREFRNSAKARNVKPYADYICRLLEGENGITPSIVLFTPKKLEVKRDNASLPTLSLPWTVQLVAIDGETQLAARYEAARMNPGTAEMLVDVKICYDRDLDWAKQAFHDLNLLSVRPNAATAVAMDMRDALTHITRKVAELPFFAGRVVTGRQLSKKDNGIATLSVLRSSVVCLSEGIGGVQYGNKPVPVDPSRIESIEIAALEFYSALASKFGPLMEDRLSTVITTPAIMAAIGACGHRLVNMKDGNERKAELHKLINELASVDWGRGSHWDGVCGKIRPNGTFSTAGGVKDSAGTSYKALADCTSDHYSKVRKAAPVAV